MTLEGPAIHFPKNIRSHSMGLPLVQYVLEVTILLGVSPKKTPCIEPWAPGTAQQDPRQSFDLQVHDAWYLRLEGYWLLWVWGNHVGRR